MREFDFTTDAITSLLTQRFWAGVRVGEPDDCWEWQKSKRSGYGFFKSGREKFIGAHRFSFVIHHGKIPEGMIVGHKCDNRCCCNPGHLEAITYSKNNFDAHSRGKRDGTQHGQLRGEAVYNAVLCDDVVLQIIELRNEGFGFKKIAAILGFSRDSIRAVVDGKTWVHITGGPVPRKT
jgi:hypothetical protein